MEENNKQISLQLENDVFSAVITLFGTLDSIRKNKDMIISEDRKSAYIRIKDEGEIIELNFDYKGLEDKIFNWLHSGHQVLHLNESESEIFRKCSHAAYYYLLEDKTMSEKNLEQNHFVKLHEQFFKKKK